MSETQLNKTPSSAFYQAVDKAIQHAESAGRIYRDLVHEAITIARNQGFNGIEIDLLVRDYCKGKGVAKSTYNIWTKQLRIEHSSIRSDQVGPVTTEESTISKKLKAPLTKLSDAINELMDKRRQGGVISGYFCWEDYREEGGE